MKTLEFAYCEKSCACTWRSARGLLALFFAVLCTAACMSCGMAGAAEVQAQDSQSSDELTSLVLGNFVLRIPSDATFERLGSSDVDAELQNSNVFDEAVDRGALCRIDAADGTTVYAYACRALMDAGDVDWANRTTDEVVLQERGEWFAGQLLYSDALLTTAVHYVGCLHYDVEEQPLTFFCFSSYVLRAGCAVGFVPLPSGYVSVIAFVFDLSQSAGAVSLVDSVVPLLEVGNGFTTAEMIEAVFEEDYEASGDALALYGITYGDEETGPYKDGYYESSMRSWTGYSPMACIQVTDGKVVAVEVADNLAYLGFGTAALEQLPSAIVAANGIEGVDVVSGATLTSEFILSATQDCLVQATACPFDTVARKGVLPQAEVDFGTCYRCHDDNLEKANHAPSRWQSTEDQVIDPHDIPAIYVHDSLNITCDDCHAVGEAPVMMCAQCHDGIAEVPEGWTAPEPSLNVLADHANAVPINQCATCHDGAAEVPKGWTIPEPSINALVDHMDVVPLDTCGSCHDGVVVRELDMAQASAGYSWRGEPFDFHDMPAELKNGHVTLLGDFSCQTCHAEQSVAACITCHSGVFTEENLPEGWTIEQSEADAADEEKAEEFAAEQAAPAETGPWYTDGTYTAEGKGISGDVPVTVTVEGGKIVSVEVGDNSETQGIGSQAVEQLPSAIVAANGTEGVDAVSGATVTSKAIFSAVDEALGQAKGDAAAEQAAPAEADKADEKAEPAAEETKADEKAEDTKADDKAAKADDKADAAAALTDGEYTAGGKGIGGKVPVTVKVEGGKVSEVTVGDNSETQGIGSKAIEQLPAKIVEAGGTEGVDAVSGATVTSKAIFSAVDDCLEQADTTDVAPAEGAKADRLADEAGALADGTYTASARCSGGIVPVLVTYEDGKAVCIEIENDSALEEDDFKAVLAAIIGCRSQAVKAAVEIDRTAVENAVAAAEFSVDAAIEAAPAAEAAAPAAESGALTDGTYTASGKGYDGEVPVTVTIEGGKIASVTVGYNYATSGISLMAINQLPAKIVAANGTEGVDAVSGATVTSKAIFTAVNSCLKQAAS